MSVLATGGGGSGTTVAMRRTCALLTLEERGDWVIDDDLALEPLRAAGWEPEVLSWRQRARPWSDFELVVIRSTWDYWEDVPGFLSVLEQIAQQTRLANPLSLVRWNLAKTYLRDLEQQGLPIVPSYWPGPLQGEGALELALATARAGFGNPFLELVIKPVIGANGIDTFRLRPDSTTAELAEAAACFTGRAALLQPFLPAILAEGEYSLFYFNGEYSHAIRKLPAAGEFRSQEERGASILPLREPEPALLARASQGIGLLDPVPLYARIDLLRDPEGEFRVMELELIEPSMYLRTEAGAPARFVAACTAWCALQEQPATARPGAPRPA